VIAAARCERPAMPVAEGIDVTRAEFEFAVTHEGALDIADILDRRTRIGLVAEDRAHAVDAAAEFLTATR
jgi:glycerol-3-phosphate dehydrogenase